MFENNFVLSVGRRMEIIMDVVDALRVDVLHVIVAQPIKPRIDLVSV